MFTVFLLFLVLGKVPNSQQPLPGMLMCITSADSSLSVCVCVCVCSSAASPELNQHTTRSLIDDSVLDTTFTTGTSFSGTPTGSLGNCE